MFISLLHILEYNINIPHSPFHGIYWEEILMHKWQNLTIKHQGFNTVMNIFYMQHNYFVVYLCIYSPLHQWDLEFTFEITRRGCLFLPFYNAYDTVQIANILLGKKNIYLLLFLYLKTTHFFWWKCKENNFQHQSQYIKLQPKGNALSRF